MLNRTLFLPTSYSEHGLLLYPTGKIGISKPCGVLAEANLLAQDPPARLTRMCLTYYLDAMR